MMDPICIECKKQGVIRKAHRTKPDLCNDHYLKSVQVSPQVAHAPVKGPTTNLLRPWETPGEDSGISIAPAAPAEEKEMPKSRTDVDWDGVKKEYQGGASASELAEKYGIHVSSVYLHVKGATRKANGNPAQAKRAKAAKINGVHGTQAGQAINQLLPELRARRDKLSAVIESLEQLESI
jgi:hypothetical protein